MKTVTMVVYGREDTVEALRLANAGEQDRQVQTEWMSGPFAERRPIERRWDISASPDKQSVRAAIDAAMMQAASVTQRRT